MGGQGAGPLELPDIHEIAAHKGQREPLKVLHTPMHTHALACTGHRDCERRIVLQVVKEAAMEAEDVARQLREAGLVAEAAALERLRCDLMAPGADLTAKKNEVAPAMAVRA